MTMVTNEDRFKSINEKQTELEAQLEATRQESQEKYERMMAALAEMM